MVISVNSQLGLRFDDKQVKYDFFVLLRGAEYFDNHIKQLNDKIDFLNHVKEEVEKNSSIEFTDEELKYYNDIIEDKVKTSDWGKAHNIVDKVIAITDTDLVFGKTSKYFFICESVYKAAELIKVSDTFTGRTLKDINFGVYTYLMGKHKMIRFKVALNAIRGFYYDENKKVAFDWGIEMEDGNYFYDENHQTEFTEIMRILTFVELGDIEILELKGGRNNGGKKNLDKITNTSNNTVYVVDSSWNKIIIRTTGFAVRGHFRLQPYGESMKDRKLIWISAFEKHGYHRRPTAEIVRH